LQIPNVDVSFDGDNEGVGSGDNRSNVILPGPQPEHGTEIKEEEVAVTEHLSREPSEKKVELMEQFICFAAKFPGFRRLFHDSRRYNYQFFLVNLNCYYSCSKLLNLKSNCA
jgi:hypothetical protein